MYKVLKSVYKIITLYQVNHKRFHRFSLAFFIPINYIISDKTKQNDMATDSSSSDLTLEDLAKDYIKEDYREWFLRYCEETFCVMRTDFVSQETCDAYYEYFKKNRWR
jgi:hypothetical protein